MLHYPKIPDSRHCQLGPCVIFEKLDGTNLHWDWHRDYGWHAFGTRRDSFNLLPEGIRQFEAAHPDLRGAAGVFLDSLAQPLAAALAALGAAEEAVAFTEYLGEGSFAGLHRAGDLMRTVLFDVQVGGQILDPEDFLRRFSHLSIPRVLYRGKFRGQLLEEIFEGKFGVAEGVVVKGPGWMAKVKTRAYLERLKGHFGESWADYWE